MSQENVEDLIDNSEGCRLWGIAQREGNPDYKIWSPVGKPISWKNAKAVLQSWADLGYTVEIAQYGELLELIQFEEPDAREDYSRMRNAIDRGRRRQ